VADRRLLVAAPRPAGRLRERRRAPVDDRGELPGRQGPAGLDEHQVRTWTAWHRWVTLAMLALAFLTITAAAERAQPPPGGMIPVTRNEIARLAAALTHQPAGGTGHLLRWSAWRRRHQHTARACHYQRQADQDP
jgi:hypothetical protein